MHLISKVIPWYRLCWWTWWSRQCILIYWRRLNRSRFIYPNGKTPGLGLTSREKFFIKEGLHRIVYYISAPHETIAFHALYLPKVGHKLRLRRELIVPSCGRNKYICLTTKDSHFRDVWFIASECFKRCLPFKVGHRSLIVAVHSMFYRELPPGLRDARLHMQSPFFIHDGAVKSFSASILLGNIWYTLKDFNSLCL
jgi:hypothetical protein